MRALNLLLRLDSVSLAFGSRPLLDAVDLQVHEGERVCLVGRNGEGKSSLLRLVSGAQLPDAGRVWVQPNARIATLAQDIENVVDGTVREVVAPGLDPEALQHEPWRAEHQLQRTLSLLGLDGARAYRDLSGGWRRRALLARALVADPAVLLLDEPTNHLDISAIEWLEEFMLGYAGALLFVSHDRQFVNRLATRIVELDRGQLSSWPGNYEAYVSRKAEQLRAEAIERALFDKKLAAEEVWIRKGVEARRTRNEGRVRALYALREARRQRRERQGRVELTPQEALESGRKVFETEDAAVRFGDRTVLQPFSTTILRGDRVGIVGPNGAGKSTLIRLLLGEQAPSQGRVEQGTRLEVAYYDQQRAQLKLEESVMANVAGRHDHVVVNGQSRHVAGYLRDFLFRPEQLRTPAAALSGGERNRLLLARLFATPANLLVLDEPTNDLDLDTLELLEEMLAEFAGTLLLVSHDRTLLDRVVTTLLVLEGDGSVQEFVGGYTDWVNWRTAQQRQMRQTAAPPAAAVLPVPAAGRARPAKLSYNDQREYDALPARIESLEAGKAQLEATVARPDFYARAHTEVAEVLQQLHGLGEQIDAAYGRWEVLDARLRGAG